MILSLQAVANASNASLGTLSKGILPRLPACVRHSSNADVHQELLALLVLLVREIEVTSPARPTCAHSPARPPTYSGREVSCALALKSQKCANPIQAAVEALGVRCRPLMSHSGPSSCRSRCRH